MNSETEKFVTVKLGGLRHQPWTHTGPKSQYHLLISLIYHLSLFLQSTTGKVWQHCKDKIHHKTTIQYAFVFLRNASHMAGSHDKQGNTWQTWNMTWTNQKH